MRKKAQAPRYATPARTTEIPLQYHADVRDRIEDGDLLLFSGSIPFSKLIERVSGGEYSHSAMLFRWGARVMILQAEFPQLQAVPASKFIEDYSGKVDWFRLTPEARRTFQPARLLDAATHFLGHPFAVTDLLRVGLHNLLGTPLPVEKHPDHDFFCSEYVSHCYRHANVDLVPEKLEDVWVAPDDIAHSDKVEYVATLHWDADRRPDVLKRALGLG